MKYVLVLALGWVLLGCTSTPIKVDNTPQVNTTLFLKMLYSVSSNSPPVYNSPITKEQWTYINTINNIHYYIENTTLKFNETISFTILSDSRAQKRNLVFVKQRGVVNCKSKQLIVDFKEIIMHNNVSFKTNDTTVNHIKKNTISESICFAFDMIIF